MERASVLMTTAKNQSSGIAAARGVVYALIFGLSGWGLILGLAWIAHGIALT